LKDIFETTRTLVDRGKEPLEDLAKIRDFLNTILADESILNDKVDKDYRRYFYEDFSGGILKRLTKEKSKDEKVCISPLLIIYNFSTWM
jgi:hypothetical protein